MALESTQPLTEMSTRNLPGGKGRPARKADNLTAICKPISTIIDLFDIIHGPVFLLKRRFGGWILSPSSGKNLLFWAQSADVIFISRDKD
jgi:hypothetical protein